jgi:phosphoadenosine phosphosulfate reductase
MDDMVHCRPGIIPLQVMVDNSIEFIRAHEPPEGYLLCDSFGKDSTVLLELARMSGVKYHAAHSFTGIDAPELIKFGMKYHPETKLYRPVKSLWQGIRDQFPPTFNKRWCCDLLKKDSTRHIPLNVKLIGARAEESYGRTKRGKINKHKGKLMLSPIFEWLEYHVWGFIEGLNIPYSSLYDEGFSRLGCVVCPLICGSNLKKVTLHKERWPKYYKTFEHAVAWWFLNKAGDDRARWKTPEMYLNAWYKAFH